MLFEALRFQSPPYFALENRWCFLLDAALLNQVFHFPLEFEMVAAKSAKIKVLFYLGGGDIVDLAIQVFIKLVNRFLAGHIYFSLSIPFSRANSHNCF